MSVGSAASAPDDTTPAQLAARLEGCVAALGSAVIAYSGGVDSAVVLMAAVRALGPRGVGLLAVSPSYPEWEYQDAVTQAHEMGAELVVAHTSEMEDPRYVANAPDRCFYCKTSLFDACEAERTRRGLARVAYGANVDDLGEERPGHRSAHQRGVAAPLIDARLTKADVRAVAGHYGLRSAHKPALACLSSRVPHGTPISPERLHMVGRAEAALRHMGFVQLRVRFHGDLARLELDPSELERLTQPALRSQVVEAVRAAGFVHVTVDLAGYRSGGANAPAPAGRLRVL